MKKFELRKLICEAIEEADRRRLDEGMGKEVAEKLIVWLLKKIAKENPEKFKKIDAAVRSKDEKSIYAIFHDPNVEKEKKAITETILMESNDKNGFLRKMWEWIKSNPKISADVALAIVGVLISLYFSGNFTTLLDALWPGILKSSATGAISGAMVKGGSNVFNQYKSYGSADKMDWGEAGKETAKGFGMGAISGLAGGMLGGAGSSIANTAGAIAGGVTAKAAEIIQALGESPSGKTVFSRIYKHRSDKNFPHLNRISSEIENWYKWLFLIKNTHLSTGDLEEEPVKTNLLKLLRGDISDGELRQIRSDFEGQHGSSIP